MHVYRLVDIFSLTYEARWPVSFSCNVDNNVSGYQKHMGGHASHINVGSMQKFFFDQLYLRLFLWASQNLRRQVKCISTLKKYEN